MGLIKDRNSMDLTEAENIKKTRQEYTEELYKKDLHDPDNHDGVITHIEPDSLVFCMKYSAYKLISRVTVYSLDVHLASHSRMSGSR